VVVLKEAKKLENFIAAAESKVIEMAEREGVRIKIERDFRGRFATLIIRAVDIPKTAGEKMVLTRKVNGNKVKEGQEGL
jgi:hypothetical protein